MLRLPGFKYQRLEDYKGTEPAFHVRDHLTGLLISEGMIHGPSGAVVSRFVAKMEGRWDGATGTLTEDFQFASGDTQQRKWEMKAGNDGSFTATAHDVIGTAHGQTEGAMSRMAYKLKLSDDAGGHVLNVIDWMYLMENGTILNRSQMFKFGLKVAELVATIRTAERRLEAVS